MTEKRGFSIIEVLIVVVLTSIGFIALIQLQIGTLRGIGSSRNIFEATNLAEHVIETMRIESLEWIAPGSVMTSQPTQFPYLYKASEASLGGSSGWLPTMLSTDQDHRVGSLGNNLNSYGGILQQIPPDRNKKFCVHYRLTWLIPDYLLRAEVRVLWTRMDGDHSLYEQCETGMVNDLANVGSITIPATVSRNIFVR